MENLTISRDFFSQNMQIHFWSFKVLYRFDGATSSSSINFEMNQSPQNGTCTISPHNGTVNTLFKIICSSWSDEDGINYYSLYGMEIDINILKNSPK